MVYINQHEDKLIWFVLLLVMVASCGCTFFNLIVSSTKYEMTLINST